MFTSAEKKRRLARTGASGSPIWCAWQVTYRCNFRCRFCGYWHDPMGLHPEPTPADFAAGARKLARFGSVMISLAGGEPFLRTDLPEIVGELNRMHFPFVTTNGWFVTEPVAREIMSAGLWGASVSIDYADEHKHDAARGMDGAWDQAWRAVELLSAARKHRHQRVNVMCVLLDDNLDQLESIIRRAAQLDAYFMIQPYGRLKTGSRAFEHKPGTVSRHLLALRKKYPNFLSNPIYLSRFDEFLESGISGCRAGRAFFNIDSTGDVAICVENKHRPVANIFRDSAGTVRRRLLAAGKDARTCTQCWYNCRGEIESLFHPIGLVRSLPTLLLDRGKP
ncbi:MAG: radical SAM/SPASM domain-containing protein, partial [Phycisphaerae bacterium]